jgi:chemotaxis protein MotB
MSARKPYVEFDEAQPGANAPTNRAWMVTFTDLVSLMLTFFVMLFAMSSVKVEAFKNMASALSQTLNPARVESVLTPTARFNISTVFRKRAINLDYLAGVLQETIGQDSALTGTRVIRLDDRLMIAVPGDLVFTPGRAVLSPTSREALFNLGGILRNIDNQISVEGHTDPAPPAGTEFPTNWELSLARAVAVANALKRAGYTEDILARGYADSRYTELPAIEEPRRRALGRRVDIIISPDVGGL